MAAHQAPLSLGFSRQEHWSGLPFPSPMHESEVSQSCPTLSDPMDCSPLGSSVYGIFQARVLEWGAILDGNSVKVSVVENSHHDKEKNLLKKRGIKVPNSQEFRGGPAVRTWCSLC